MIQKQKRTVQKWKQRHRTKHECEGLREACAGRERFQMRTKFQLTSSIKDKKKVSIDTLIYKIINHRML